GMATRCNSCSNSCIFTSPFFNTSNRGGLSNNSGLYKTNKDHLVQSASRSLN
ncbi:NADH dehydrogenase subunit 5, partial [Caligus rogercresseyi]